MHFGVLEDFHGYLRMIVGSGYAVPPGMMRAILRTYQTQSWFQQQQGTPMARRPCEACACERIFTIWCDGNYCCLFCLYRQAWEGNEGPIPLETTPAVMREFTQMWLSFRRHSRVLDDGWMLAEERSFSRLPRPPDPLCEADDCKTCRTCRPHVAGPKGKRCFYCLMKQGLLAVPITQPKRPTRERLDEVARLAVAHMYVSA